MCVCVFVCVRVNSWIIQPLFQSSIEVSGTTTPAVNSTSIIRRVILGWIRSIHRSITYSMRLDVSIFSALLSVVMAKIFIEKSKVSWDWIAMLIIRSYQERQNVWVKEKQRTISLTVDVDVDVDNIITIEQCVNMSIKEERINSHLHFLTPSSNAHTHRLALKTWGSDEWSFVALPSFFVYINLFCRCRSQYGLIYWHQLNSQPIQISSERKMTWMCEFSVMNMCVCLFKQNLSEHIRGAVSNRHLTVKTRKRLLCQRWMRMMKRDLILFVRLSLQCLSISFANQLYEARKRKRKENTPLA